MCFVLVPQPILLPGARQVRMEVKERVQLQARRPQIEVNDFKLQVLSSRFLPHFEGRLESQC